MPLPREPHNCIQVQEWDAGGGGVGCGPKSIHADLGRLRELLVRRAWRGPGVPLQCPRLIPSVRVFHEPEQLPDLLADDFHGLREVLLQRCVLCEVLPVPLTKLLEERPVGTHQAGSPMVVCSSELVHYWFSRGFVCGAYVVQIWHTLAPMWSNIGSVSFRRCTLAVQGRFNFGSNVVQVWFNLD